MAKGIADALDVSFELLGHLHDLLYGSFFHTCKPEFKELLASANGSHPKMALNSARNRQAKLTFKFDS